MGPLQKLLVAIVTMWNRAPEKKNCSMSEAKSLSNYKFDYSMRNQKKKHILWRPHSYSETRGFKLDGSSRKR